MFNFKELIKTGMDHASQVEANRQSVESVFASLNGELSAETDGLFTIARFEKKISPLIEFARSYTMKEQDGELALDNKGRSGTLNVLLKNGLNASIARWEQAPDGYPFTIEFMGERTDCWDQEALVEALGKIIVSGQLWLKVKELQKKEIRKPQDSSPGIGL
ncbi:hypothetical protein ACB496_11690 [Lelliottia nimipressuralis]|uniref:hypothetical protein n=1 Tax=Lelliottia nimipressuralis TaxID=69220 RepID=UPI003558679D